MSVGWQRGSINNIELTNVRESPAPEKQAEGKLQGRKVTVTLNDLYTSDVSEAVRVTCGSTTKVARLKLLEVAETIAGQIDRKEISQSAGKAQVKKLIKAHIETYKGQVNAAWSKIFATLDKGKAIVAPQHKEKIQMYIEKEKTDLEKALKDAEKDVKHFFSLDFAEKINDQDGKYVNFQRSLDKIGVSLTPPLRQGELALLGRNRRSELLKAPAKSSLDKAASLISRVRVDSFSPKLHGLISHVKNAFNRT